MASPRGTSKGFVLGISTGCTAGGITLTRGAGRSGGTPPEPHGPPGPLAGEHNHNQGGPARVLRGVLPPPDVLAGGVGVHLVALLVVPVRAPRRDDAPLGHVDDEALVTFCRNDELHPMEKPVFRYFQGTNEFYLPQLHRELVNAGVVVNDPWLEYCKDEGIFDELKKYPNELNGRQWPPKTKTKKEKARKAFSYY
eukprot:CAMPEP_0201477430 /NCGR_PEP_ID=MMETSP0151_2-20130828/2447_1 /ASSEMBLY_ACC=CAM_ASM_000257 /TAXON_ID=200890 /ORGANISM="Paramoeba atlantica, Strain 621/1 / CCAP 1560/9" /LENGTH=195 /DNA_ID=CAMNT_0047858141 /DNA_START=220 /DNA_END=809 /DNA_ORIENTATION=-